MQFLRLLRLVTTLHDGGPSDRTRASTEAGQASVEYALVLLGAALVATLLNGWATKTDLLNQLFDHVLNLIRGKAS